MLKKFLVALLIAAASFTFGNISEAADTDNYCCGDYYDNGCCDYYGGNHHGGRGCCR